jgi:hypothetical protein
MGYYASEGSHLQRHPNNSRQTGVFDLRTGYTLLRNLLDQGTGILRAQGFWLWH